MNVDDVLNRCRVELDEMKKAASPEVADFIVDIETAQKFVADAIKEGEIAVVRIALRKTAELLSDEEDGKGQEILAKDIKGALKALE